MGPQAQAFTRHCGRRRALVELKNRTLDEDRLPFEHDMARHTEQTHPNAAAFPAIGGPALRALAAAGVRSLGHLTEWREEALLALHGMGPKGIRILRDALAARGLAFRRD